MTKFYEIATATETPNSAIINIDLIVAIKAHNAEEGKPAHSSIWLTDGTELVVVTHSLMNALHHSETPYMLMNPEGTMTESLDKLGEEDITDLSDTIEGQV